MKVTRSIFSRFALLVLALAFTTSPVAVIAATASADANDREITTNGPIIPRSPSVHGGGENLHID